LAIDAEAEDVFQRFSEAGYLREMATLISTAKRSMLGDHADAMVYTVSIWTDPDAAVSAISFDTIENSLEKIRQANEWTKKHYDRLMSEGEVDEAQLFLPQQEGRNCNPADFAFRNLAKLTHASFKRGWEQAKKEKCWNVLEPALLKVANLAHKEFSELRLRPDAQLGINSRRAWYDRHWPVVPNREVVPPGVSDDL
jgi:hypothetical protein